MTKSNESLNRFKDASLKTDQLKDEHLQITVCYTIKREDKKVGR